MAAPNDSARVLVFPPLIPAATIFLSVLLQWLHPLGIAWGADPAWRIFLGCLVMLGGGTLLIAGGRGLARNGTPVSPARPAKFLVRTGAYRLSRNPMYVGGSLMMAGLGVTLALGWLLLLLPLSLLLLHAGVVRREEMYLEGKFGDDYRRYRSGVPRYLGLR